jgi:hypothetical protein
MTDKQDPASLSPDEVPTPYGSAAGIESVTLVAAPLLAGGALALTGVVVQQEDSLALGPVPMVWQATAAMGRGDPCGPAGCRPHPDDQAHPAPQRGAGWVHHPRLSPRHPGRQPQVPGGPGRADHQLGPGQLRPLVPGLPAAPALHHRQGWPQRSSPPARGRAARSAAPGDDPDVPAELSAVAADGGTLDRVAGRRRLPAGALPRHPAQRPVVVAAGGRGQPATAAGTWPCPPRRCLGAGLTALSAPLHRLDRPPTAIVPGAGRPSLRLTRPAALI